MSLSPAFNKLHGRLLDLGARFNSVALCRLSFGRTNIFNNSRALRTAAERKKYDVLKYMLNKSSESIMGMYSFGFGKDWDRVGELAKKDKELDFLMRRYDSNLDKAIERLMAEVEAMPDPPRLRLI